MPTTYAIPNGRTAMDATLYTGTGTTLTVNNTDLGTTGFKPDLVWMKCRSNTANHGEVDSVRGTTKALFPNLTNTEGTYTDLFNSFNTNGFTLGNGTGYDVTNLSGYTYVAWQWVAGQGVNNTNTVGSITSTVSANTTTGFSIVTYTGTGANATVGHGLSTAPKIIFIKNRSGSFNWIVYSASIGATNFLKLNLNDASAADSLVFNNTSPTSSVFSIGTGGSVNNSGNSFVAYCWAEVPGFSQFGSYTGNGSADGPFVYTGFRPKFWLVKNTSAVQSWFIFDSSRNLYNVTNSRLWADTSNAESSNVNTIDLLSNGFKLRDSDSAWNSSGATYIYMAFAENPFKYANAR